MESVNRALLLKKELDALRPLKKEDERRIMQKFRLDWNYHSNHLEGNSLTYGETKALILYGITASGKPLKDHFEITGHNEAIKWVIEVLKKERPLTENFIRQVHKIILKEPYIVEAITPGGKQTKKKIHIGEYKKTPNHVLTKSGEIFYFATPEETPAKMHDLLTWYESKKEEADVNPIFLAGKFHYDFVRIHPFDDGNGRMARILMNFILMKFGFPPVVIKTEEKEEYYAVLKQADAGVLEPFIDFVAKNLVRSLEIMIKGAKGESIEEADDLDKEISLLEQQLKTVGESAEINKSKESILQFFDDSIAKLVKAFISGCEKLDKHYSDSLFSIYIPRRYKKKPIIYTGKNTALTAARNNFLAKKTDFILLQYDYKGFNHKEFEEFNFESMIRIQFNPTRILLRYKNSENKIIKFYGEKLNDEEIDKIVKSELRRHKEFIEQKLEEVRNNNV